MARRKTTPRSTKPERSPQSRHELGARQHAIMTVLWEAGEATVAQVHEALTGDEARALTTVATMLTKMEAKGVVEARREGRQLVYRPTVTREEVRRTMVGSLTETLFGGRPEELVSHLLDEQALSDADVDRLRTLLEQHGSDAGRKGGRRDDA
jgi:BlaI family transcriptional regulator, penicillinase repressor